MLAGLIRDDERKVRDGIPGLSDIPGVGRLFGHSRNERTQTDVILMLTPRIVRVLELTEEDLRAFKVGRDAGRRFGAAGRAALRRAALAASTFRCPTSRCSRSAPARPGPASRRAPTGAGPAAGAAAAQPPPNPGQPRRNTMRQHASGSASDRGACLRSRHGRRPSSTARASTPTTSSIAPPRTSLRPLLDGRDDLNEARVAFLVTPGFDYVAVQWGIWRAGGIAVPLPMSHPPAELEYLVRDSEASIVVADARQRAGRRTPGEVAAVNMSIASAASDSATPPYRTTHLPSLA